MHSGRVSVGRDQHQGAEDRPSRRGKTGLGRAQTFALGILVGTFVVAPVGSTLLGWITAPSVEDPLADEPVLEAEPAPDDQPEVTLAVDSATVTATVAEGPTNRVTSGEVQPNQFVADILIAAGATSRDADLCARALAGKFDFRKSRPGHGYEVEVDPEGQVVRFEYRAAPDERYHVERGEDGAYEGNRIEVALDHEIVLVQGAIEVSLWEAFVAAGESPNLAMTLADAFRFDIDFFHDTRKGDVFRFFVDKYTVDGELVRYGRVWAAEYVGAPESPVGSKRLFWWGEGSKLSQGYYDDKGKAAQRAFLRSPLKYSRVSSPFGYRRHPILKRRHFHGGVDYAAPKGTPVQAVSEGVVTWAKRKGPAGKMVRIRHAGGYESYYLHLSRILVKEGQRVSQSTVIGKVGSTGRSTGPHLDFRLKKHGKYMNPRKHVAPRTKSVPNKEKGRFLAKVAPWVDKLDAAK